MHAEGQTDDQHRREIVGVSEGSPPDGHARIRTLNRMAINNEDHGGRRPGDDEDETAQLRQIVQKCPYEQENDDAFGPAACKCRDAAPTPDAEGQRENHPNGHQGQTPADSRAESYQNLPGHHSQKNCGYANQHHEVKGTRCVNELNGPAEQKEGVGAEDRESEFGAEILGLAEGRRQIGIYAWS